MKQEPHLPEPPPPVDPWIQRLKNGDETVLADLFDFHRARLGQIVHFRLDQRLAGRIDVDDVLQESYMNAVGRVQSYLGNPAVSTFVWLRTIINQTMIDLHRRHAGADMRTVYREVSLEKQGDPNATSISLAAHLLASLTSPSQAVMKEELAQHIRQSIDEMDPLDREVLALRHYEELTNTEVSEVLKITQAAASVRYVRAVSRLRGVLESLPGFTDS